MWTQRDQIQAYQFLRRRLVSALVSADANHPVPPAKRLGIGLVVGLAVAFLVAAVYGIIGVLTPARAAEWRQTGQVIIEKETGTRYVLGADGTLHPVANYASARLLAGGDGSRTIVVPAKALRDVPRGPVLGIAGAPDSLPRPDRLLSGSWTSCSRNAPDRPDDTAPDPVVLIGQSVSGRELAPGQGFVALSPSGERFLITEGTRFRFADDRAVVALGYASADPVPVAAGWLNTLRAGRDLRTIRLPDAGAAGPVIGGRDARVGDVLTSGGEYFLVSADGLTVITETEARLVGSADPIPVAADEIPGVPERGAGGYPVRLPEPVPVERAMSVCATGERIVLGAGLASAGVNVPGGAGALVTEEPGGTVYLVTDTGFRHPIPNPDAVAALGFGGAPRQPVPAGLLALIPTGPALDPAAAAQPPPR